MLLRVRDLVVHYANVVSLKGISLDVAEGEIVALVGANGAGKSTLLRAVSGIKNMTSGEINFAGRRIDRLDPAKIVALGIVQIPEGRGIFPYMTVMENLKMGAYLRKDKREIRDDLENVFRHFPVLKQRVKQEAGSLSGGEQQILVIARALMAKPKLLLMDEPSLGLSPLMVREIARTITDINRQRGVSIIVAEQNTRVALSIAQRVYVMEMGRVAIEGESKTLLNNEVVKKAYLA